MSGPDNTLEIEKSLLGGFLSGSEIPPVIQEGMFSDVKNRLVFSAIKYLTDEGHHPDILMVKRRLEKTNALEQAGDCAHIASLTNLTPSKANLKWYCETFIENYENRMKERAIRLAGEKIGKEPTPEITRELLKSLTEKPVQNRRKTSWTVKELLEYEFPPVQWMIPELIAPGLTLVAGASKIGKSWLALSMAYAVATGGHVLGKLSVQKHDVLYLSLEDVGRRLKERLIKIGSDKITNLQIEERWDQGVAGIANYVRQRPLTKFVIIDTWVQFFPKGDTNDYSEMSKRAASLKAVADDSDIAIMVMHHTRKGMVENGDWMDGVLGSQGLAGSADSILMLKRGRGNQQAELLATGRDIEERHLVLSFDSDCGLWTIEGNKQDIQESDTRQAIYDWLKENGAHKPGEIYTGITEEGYKGALSTIQNIVGKMTRSGALQKDDYGIYSVPSPHEVSTLTTVSTGEAAKSGKASVPVRQTEGAIESVDTVESLKETGMKLPAEELAIF